MIEFDFRELLQKGSSVTSFIRTNAAREMDRISEEVVRHVTDGRYFVNRGRGKPSMKESMQILPVDPLHRKVISVARHARFLDEGTKPHMIVAKRAKFLRFVMNGGLFFRKRVRHPGTQARWFSKKESQFVESVLPGVLEAAAQQAIAQAGLS